LTREDPKTKHGLSFIHINLKWFVEVLCHTNSEDEARWESYYEKSLVKDVTITHACRDLRSEMKQAATEDCFNALLLYYTVMAWMGLSLLGIIFTITLFHLNNKLFVTLTPNPRLTFTGTEDTEVADLEQLRVLAEKVKTISNEGNPLEPIPDLQVVEEVDYKSVILPASPEK